MKILISAAFGEGRNRKREMCYAIVRQTPNMNIGYHGEEVIALCWEKEEAEKIRMALLSVGDSVHYTDARIEDVE